MSTLIYESSKIVVGLLYPAYSSFKAVHTKNVKEYVKWMMYWIVFAFFLFIESLTDLLCPWLPFYIELKLVFLIWLMAPLTRGSSLLYRTIIHPQLVRHERDIDGYMEQVREQGYQALIALGARGFSFATDIVLTTAIKGSAQVRRSLSLSDLSTDGATSYRRFARTQSLRSEESESEEESERYRQDLEGSQMLVKRQDLAGSQNIVTRGGNDMLMRRRDLRGNQHLEALDRELLANQELLRLRGLRGSVQQQQHEQEESPVTSSVRLQRKHRQNKQDGRDAELYLVGGRDSADISKVTMETAASTAKSATSAELKSAWLTRSAFSPTPAQSTTIHAVAANAAHAAVSNSTVTATVATTYVVTPTSSRMTIYKRL